MSKAWPTLVFDCGDTLLHLSPSREEMCAAVLQDLGVEVPLAAVTQAYARVDFAMQMHSSELASDEDKAAFYARLNRAVLAALGLCSHEAAFGPRMVEAVRAQRRWVPHDGVRGALDTFSARTDLYVLANWDLGLERVLADAGLDGFFRAALSSQALGVEKPAREAFAGFLARTGLEAADCVYVGNDYVADVTGARGAGLSPVLLDVAGRYGPHVDCPYVQNWAGLTAYAAAQWGAG